MEGLVFVIFLTDIILKIICQCNLEVFLNKLVTSKMYLGQIALVTVLLMFNDLLIITLSLNNIENPKSNIFRIISVKMMKSLLDTNSMF
jgi:hypothetical protein